MNRRDLLLIISLPQVVTPISQLDATPSGCRETRSDILSKIFGKIQIVRSFPDYKVKIVNSFADLHVQRVDAFPDSAGKWQMVSSFPDYKIQFVDSFPDFTIQYVSSFPGPRR